MSSCSEKNTTDTSPPQNPVVSSRPPKRARYTSPSAKTALVRNQQKQSLKAVEQRLAELESFISDGSVTGPQRRDSEYGSQAWTDSLRLQSPNEQVMMNTAAPRRPSPVSPDRRTDDFDGRNMAQVDGVSHVEEILKDLSLEASGRYIGASSHIGIGKIISSMVQSTPDDQGSPESIHDSQGEPLSPKSAHDGPLLHLVYAIGGRFLETTGETGTFYPEQHSEQALENLMEIISFHDIRTVQVLLLLSIYSLRSPKGPGAWTYVGFAIRQCIEMGMHRKIQDRRELRVLDYEIRKRVFWCCYCLDRQVSIILGRPFAISDRDIDAELPLDIDGDVEDPDELDHALTAMKALRPGEKTKTTGMTAFIYITKLRQIESRIQQTIYRVDKSASSATKDEVEKFISELDRWRDSMPEDVVKKSGSVKSLFVDGYDYYMVYYYKCMRFLLHPIILSANLSETRFLKKCAEACGGVCQTYKKLHQTVPVGFSVMALHSLTSFAGLTLLYCTWASPKEIFSISMSNAMNSCSIVLYIITERWKGAQKYRDVFESIKQSVMDSIEEGHYEPRRAIQSLKPGLGNAVQAMSSSQEGRGEVPAMILNMAGGSSLMEDGGLDSFEYQPENHGEMNTIFSGISSMIPMDSMAVDFHTLGTFNGIDVGMAGDCHMQESLWM
ncbi:hypothetical protein N7495_002452 [Penicillium taxi]|uniref:uncharacterized protein n=1 Tax=Penicillium taxi TaxID=168475 RepID=UPI002544F6CC|nr:uncharacterized protein N7495_002452 [Penicillium taxi]KAJ5901924.1 hypothetical protein N7495_002452 [Penicillium taxi]